MEFLKYAGVSLEELLKQETFETYNALLQAASNKITDQILEYWTQNPDLSVEVKVAAGMPGDAPPTNAGTVARSYLQLTSSRGYPFLGDMYAASFGSSRSW